jgi:hypothetical protein
MDNLHGGLSPQARSRAGNKRDTNLYDLDDYDDIPEQGRGTILPG